MNDPANRQVVVKIKSYPQGEPTLDNFAIVGQPIPEPQPGQFLARTIYLSLDPYMRGRMSTAESYAKPAELDQPMVGATVGQVVRLGIPATPRATSCWATGAGSSTGSPTARACGSSTRRWARSLTPSASWACRG